MRQHQRPQRVKVVGFRRARALHRGCRRSRAWLALRYCVFAVVPLNAEFFELFIQGGNADAERFCSLGSVAAVFGERLLDRGALQTLECLTPERQLLEPRGRAGWS